MCSASAHAARARPNAPGRPKDLGKRAAILEAAKRLFVEQGYDGVSMDQIAAAAGVSKLTVYSHFGDKDALFAAAARAYCEQRLPPELFVASPEVPLRQRMQEIAQAFYAMVSAPEAVAGHRILCTPQLADSPVPAMFWEAGPKRVQGEFAQLLQRRIEAGELEIDDVPRAASQFFTLLKGDLHARLVMGCGDEAACREVAREHVAASVDMFLRAYAKR
jgi:TetR/AcrR family transcriptional repressor of mexJK operon